MSAISKAMIGEDDDELRRLAFKGLVTSVPVYVKMYTDTAVGRDRALLWLKANRPDVYKTINP
jgi:hypothetical protein